MSIQASVHCGLVVEETVAVGDVPGSIVIRYDTTHVTRLNATSTPAGSEVWSDGRQLTAGVDTIDLTDLATQNRTDKDFTGMKLLALHIQANAANAGALTFTEGATNGYALLGASGSVSIPPGGELLLRYGDGAPDVGSSDAQIDVAGTDTDGYTVIMVVG